MFMSSATLRSPARCRRRRLPPMRREGSAPWRLRSCSRVKRHSRESSPAVALASLRLILPWQSPGNTGRTTDNSPSLKARSPTARSILHPRCGLRKRNQLMHGSLQPQARLLASAPIAGVLLLVAFAANAGAEDLQPFAIVGDEIPASLTGTPGDAERGREIVGNRQVGLCL